MATKEVKVIEKIAHDFKRLVDCFTEHLPTIADTLEAIRDRVDDVAQEVAELKSELENKG